MKAHIFSGSRGKEAFASVFDLSALAEWGQEHRHGGAAAGGPVRRALAVVRGCGCRGGGAVAARLPSARQGPV